MVEIKRYLVGGAVRDRILGIKSKDLDYTIEAPSFEAMRDYLINTGHKIYVESPQFYTIRSKFNGEDADHVLARIEGNYSDGRHPDWVRPGTLFDDQSRRDFTANSIAIDPETGNYIDPFNGIQDISTKTLRAVGNPQDRLMEDPLRAFRAFRFAITKGFTIHHTLASAIKSPLVMDGLESVSTDRVRDELHRMFAYDTVGSILFFVNNFPEYLPVLEQRGIWLEPTTRKAK